VCGICGIIGGPSRDIVVRMREVLAHRGPDEAGEFVDDLVGLGHRRLSIVDLLTGQQPLHSADGSVVVVFNGEIYNHPTLRKDLEARGYGYRTNSDTETIVNAYLAFGTESVKRLDGMFAFVLYDRAKRLVFGARDRLGKKPLFYALSRQDGGSSFVFGSEIRSLLEHPTVRREAALSESAVQQYLLHDYVPGSRTMFGNIAKLEAGHAFTIDLREPTVAPKAWRYWNNPIVAPPPPLSLSEDEAAHEAGRLLEEAVKRRLMSDVPLGVFLSGGVDSSLITALLSRSKPPWDIRTFAIGFREQSFDESEFASAVSKHLGTTHRSRIFSAADCVVELARVTEQMDEPIGDPSILPMSMLCRFARESVTVALGGDGGDELFAGYDPFVALAPARFYESFVPRRLHGAAVRAAQLLPASAKNMSLSFRVQRFLRGAGVPAALRLSTWMSPVAPAELGRLLPNLSLSADALRPEADLYEAVRNGAGDEVQAALAYFQRFYLTDDILVKVDRASMMHGLEVRAPFLDTAFVEFVNRLPSHLKLRSGARKYLLKQIANRMASLPAAILKRAKKGFGIPVAQWIRKELRMDFRDALMSDWPQSLEMIDRREVERLLSAHVAGRENNYKELWALFIIVTWARRWTR
jgi:asparagine synthase (glutamine-hydrolysing)